MDIKDALYSAFDKIDESWNELKGIHPEIRAIVKLVNLDSYLKYKNEGRNEIYWKNNHIRVLDGLYEILMEGHKDLLSKHRGRALYPIAHALNEVVETHTRPVKITETKKTGADEKKMYFGPANFAYLFDGNSIVQPGKNVMVVSTITGFEKTIDPETDKVSYKFKGIKYVPLGDLRRNYQNNPTNYNPTTYTFGNYQKDIMAKMDVRNALKIFGPVDASKERKPIRAGETVQLNYKIVRIPAPPAQPPVKPSKVIEIVTERAGGSAPVSKSKA